MSDGMGGWKIILSVFHKSIITIVIMSEFISPENIYIDRNKNTVSILDKMDICNKTIYLQRKFERSYNSVSVTLCTW